MNRAICRPESPSPRRGLSRAQATAVVLACALGCLDSFADTDLTNSPPPPLPEQVLVEDTGEFPSDAEAVPRLKQVLKVMVHEVEGLRPRADEAWSRARVLTTLRGFDTALGRLGFVHPARGGVDTLADALKPMDIPPAERRALVAETHNRRRQALLAGQVSGPVHFGDCDTLSLIYLGAAERIGLPLQLTFIPSCDRRPSHILIAWGTGRHRLYWETLEATERSGDQLKREWHISSTALRSQVALRDLSAREVRGYGWYLRAIRWERAGEAMRAIKCLRTGLELFPQHADAHRELAWLIATAPTVEVRDHQTAWDSARMAAESLGDSDSLDTLAAVLASSGRFEEAIHQERRALAQGGAGTADRAAYRARLRLYQQHQPFRAGKKLTAP